LKRWYRYGVSIDEARLNTMLHIPLGPGAL
jgi:hypothetical protein